MRPLLRWPAPIPRCVVCQQRLRLVISVAPGNHGEVWVHPGDRPADSCPGFIRT